MAAMNNDACLRHASTLQYCISVLWTIWWSLARLLSASGLHTSPIHPQERIAARREMSKKKIQCFAETVFGRGQHPIENAPTRM